MNRKGISLVEILVGTTVAAIAGGLIINLMVSSNRIFINQTNQASQGLSLNQSAREITNLIKSTSGISNQYPPAGTPQFITDSDSLVLKLPALASGGQIIDSVFDYAVISADTSNPAILRKQIFVDPAVSERNPENQVLSTSLNTLTFRYLDTSNNPAGLLETARINFVLTLKQSNGLPEKESSASGTVNIKNL